MLQDLCGRKQDSAKILSKGQYNMATKLFDVSKFRKSLTKSIDGLGVGFKDPDTWISTGNYALNYLISGDFNKGIPLGKVTVFAGESGCLPRTALVSIASMKEKITVEDLDAIYNNPERRKKVEISTPDGYQEITKWFNKGVLPMVKIVAANGLSTICATNHLLLKSDYTWIPAGELQVDDVVCTILGDASVTEVTNSAPEECYDFTVDHPNHRYYGDDFVCHNSGKSYICSGNIIKNAQEQGVFVVLIDSENALDESWMHALGVDTSEDKLLKLSLSMIDDVAKTISEFMKSYKEMPEGDRPKVLFVVDSLGMLLTPTDVTQFEAGELKGDMGRKPKALTALVRNCINMFGSYNVGMVATNHSYASQDPYSPDPIVSGGQGVIYAASIVVAMKKLKLKEDEDGNKVTEVLGIRSGCKIMKTRYSKPFEDIQLQIPYSTGMNPTSGLFDLLEKRGLIKKDGNRYAYVDLQGEIHKYYRKEWGRNINNIFDLVMKEFADKEIALAAKLVAEADEPVADSE